ncbi:MAG: cell division protein FtsL [Myxococcales bacterium]|nr:cell division protein FtsL [Myxococcales bacterium]
MKARFLTLWSAAVVATALAFVMHLALRFETVRLGYAVSKARREQRSLLDNRRLLSLEAATLRQNGRIEYVARHVLGMEVPDGDRIVQVRRDRMASNIRGSR